jgi:hypothetical protein
MIRNWVICCFHTRQSTCLWSRLGGCWVRTWLRCGRALCGGVHVLRSCSFVVSATHSKCWPCLRNRLGRCGTLLPISSSTGTYDCCVCVEYPRLDKKKKKKKCVGWVVSCWRVLMNIECRCCHLSRSTLITTALRSCTRLGVSIYLSTFTPTHICTSRALPN